MRRTGLIGSCLSVLLLAGCGVGGAGRAATSVQVPGTAATSAPVSRTAAATRSVRHPTRVQQRNDDGTVTMAAESFDELNRRYRDAQVLERHLGTASYYADSLTGRSMANGQAYEPSRPTMAHRTLPFGTVVRVVRVSTGAAVVVHVTDRGPFGKAKRIADLSREAARRLDMIREGVVGVRLEVLTRTREEGLRKPSRRN